MNRTIARIILAVAALLALILVNKILLSTGYLGTLLLPLLFVLAVLILAYGFLVGSRPHNGHSPTLSRALGRSTYSLFTTRQGWLWITGLLTLALFLFSFKDLSDAVGRIGDESARQARYMRGHNETVQCFRNLVVHGTWRRDYPEIRRRYQEATPLPGNPGTLNPAFFMLLSATAFVIVYFAGRPETATPTASNTHH